MCVPWWWLETCNFCYLRFRWWILRILFIITSLFIFQHLIRILIPFRYDLVFKIWHIKLHTCYWYCLCIHMYSYICSYWHLNYIIIYYFILYYFSLLSFFLLFCCYLTPKHLAFYYEDFLLMPVALEYVLRFNAISERWRIYFFLPIVFISTHYLHTPPLSWLSRFFHAWLQRVNA